MSKLQVTEFKSYEEEAAFWDNFDTADFMADDGEWFQFETPVKGQPLAENLAERKSKDS
jgi:hypothetical protein